MSDSKPRMIKKTLLLLKEKRLTDKKLRERKTMAFNFIYFNTLSFYVIISGTRLLILYILTHYHFMLL